jgi:hypothetical protein
MATGEMINLIAAPDVAQADGAKVIGVGEVDQDMAYGL